ADGGQRQGRGQGTGGTAKARAGVLALRRRTGRRDAVLVLVPPPLGQFAAGGAHVVDRLASWPELLVAAQQVFLVGLGEVRVGDRGGQLAQARLQRRPLLGRVQRLGVAFADEQGLGEAGGPGELRLERGWALLSQHLVGVLAAFDDGELEAAAGLQQR